MRVRFGFVAMAPGLADASPARMLTVTAARKMDLDSRLHRLRETARANLDSTLRILRHAHAHGVGVYRFSSRLIPLATHDLTEGWDWAAELAPEFAAVGAFVRDHDMRVSFHPDHYAPLSSPRPEVQAAARRDYAYHTRMVAAMGLSGRVRLIVHVGGRYGDAAAAMDRFARAFRGLDGARDALAIENDDRVYDGAAVLALARRVGAPAVLDFHHQRVLRGHDGLPALVLAAAETWGQEVPKFHLSSSASDARPRGHAEFIAVPDAEAALMELHAAGIEAADVMVEAKGKDAAVFRIVAELAASGRWSAEGEAIVRGPRLP